MQLARHWNEPMSPSNPAAHTRPASHCTLASHVLGVSAPDDVHGSLSVSPQLPDGTSSGMYSVSLALESPSALKQLGNTSKIEIAKRRIVQPPVSVVPPSLVESPVPVSVSASSPVDASDPSIGRQ